MTIAALLPLLFLGLMLLISYKQFGVKTFDDYATASRSIGTLGITFGVLATWYVGATFTAWAGFAVGSGFVALYVTPYALITLVVMYLVCERTFVWGKLHNIETQAELLGYRYQSDWVRVLTAFAGVAWSVPWLLMEWVTLGFVANYASGGVVSPFWGMALGVLIVAAYVGMGGMRSVITANIVQGLYMFVVGTGLMVWLIYRNFGSIGQLLDTVTNEHPEVVTFPGHGLDLPPAYWVSIVITSGLGGFMWPWVYNKIFAADSVRTLKRTVLLTPALGTVFYLVFVLLGMGIFLSPALRANPQEAFMAFASDNGQLVLGLIAVLVTAASISTVSGIMNAMSTAISNDVTRVVKRDISSATALRVARWSIVIIGAVALAGATVREGLLIELALLTYQGIMVLFPVVILGLYWRRANKQGALTALVSGTAVSFGLMQWQPEWLLQSGWSSGIFGIIVAFGCMIVCGFAFKPTPHVQSLWDEIGTARARAHARARAATAAARNDRPADPT